MSDGGKGSKPRPYSVSQDKFADNWDIIFSKKNEKQANQTGKINQSSKPGGMDVQELQSDPGR